MSAASVNGLTIEHDVHGPDDGEPLLLVMGLGGQLIAWPDAFVERLVAEGFRVIRFDNRDVGLSTHWPTPPPRPKDQLLALVSRRFAKSDYVLRDMAADAAGLLDHLGIESAHVCGMSMGGMIAQTMAIEFPDRVRSLTSIMSNTGDRKHGKIHRSLLHKAPRLLRNDGDRIANSVRLFRMISGPHFDAVENRDLAEAALARSDDTEGTARQMMAIAASPDRTPDLRRVRVPTLVIHGLLDPLVKPDGGVATAKAVPGSRLVMFPDMAHDIPRPRWDDIVAEIVSITRAARGGVDDRVPVAS